jgi:hypothetical protein
MFPCNLIQRQVHGQCRRPPGPRKACSAKCTKVRSLEALYFGFNVHTWKESMARMMRRKFNGFLTLLTAWWGWSKICSIVCREQATKLHYTNHSKTFLDPVRLLWFCDVPQFLFSKDASYCVVYSYIIHVLYLTRTVGYRKCKVGKTQLINPNASNARGATHN